MKKKGLFTLFCCLLLLAVAFVLPLRSQRTKRGLIELAGAIKCSTGRSALAYMMYGCYCGLGGQGWPRDRKTCMFFIADNLKDMCEKLQCKCDRDAAKCLRKAPFIQKYAVWPDLLCGYKQPTCNIY
uniref:group 10 secretory phospholipase A2 n=1 Tax=Monopterus albus TaxID=43700 RepID=UPI0009B4A0C7|nr:group 10 secretory phospholipase A2-like [Monopterus albus]